MNKLFPYQIDNIIELGIYVSGKDALFGPVYIAGVILPNNIIELCERENIIISDSKKMSKKERERSRLFIEKNSIYYYFISKDNNIIDENNIVVTIIEGICDIVNKMSIKPDKILINGDNFKIDINEISGIALYQYIAKVEEINMCITSASIIAKTYKDKYIKDIVTFYPDLNKYDLLNNSGYGTQMHVNTIKMHGITHLHRKTFGICKKFFF
jgi:ribonuclease HII